MNDINIENLLERISMLSKERGMAMNTAFVESHVGKNFAYNLKYSNPSEGKLTLLANYFGVSLDYLVGLSDDKGTTKLTSGENTLANIVKLMQNNSCDNQALSSALGLNRQAVTDWKAGRSKSYKKYLPQIAEYFGVSVDYLIGKKILENELNGQESVLLQTFRKTTDEGRQRMIQSVLNIYDETEKNSLN